VATSPYTTPRLWYASRSSALHGRCERASNRRPAKKPRNRRQSPWSPEPQQRSKSCTRRNPIKQRPRLTFLRAGVLAAPPPLSASIFDPVRWWVTRASRCPTAANRPACNWPPSSLRPPARPRAVCCTVAEAGSASGEEKILSGQQHFSVWAWVERASSGSKPKPSHATHAHTLLVASFFSQELPTS
jgi:hypothetical protein